MTLFHDEWRSCIHCDELAQIVVELLLREEQGMFTWRAEAREPS